MWPNLLEIGWFKLNIFGIYLAATVIGVSFGIWKKFRIDYKDEEIFTLTLSLFTGLIAGSIAGGLIESGNWWTVSGWGLVFGGVAAVWKWSGQSKSDFWEHWDWFTVLTLWLWLAGAATYGPGAGYSLAGAFVSLLLTGLVKANYRKFRWYKSGKVGIVGLSALSAYAVYEIIAGIMASVTVYWWGLTLSQTIAAWVIAFCVAAVYLRSGNKFKFPDKLNVRIGRYEIPKQNRNQEE